MQHDLRAALGQALGAPVKNAAPLSGGDINEAFAVTLDSGQEVFVKTNARADARLFWCEAQGLAWLAQAQALPVPRVLAVSDPAQPGPHFLALELIRPGRKRRDYDEVLGRGLAAVHRAGAESFGLPYDNFLATLVQDNTPCATWSELYGQRRLMPQVHLAMARGRIPGDWLPLFERLLERLDELLAPAEPPARVHGDLWGGNLHVDPAGNPVLIDPAVHGGHREVDLAMLALFGGVSQRMFEAYHEAYPLAPSWSSRVPLHQLYPLLVHVNLFGSSYAGAVERALRRYV